MRTPGSNKLMLAAKLHLGTTSDSGGAKSTGHGAVVPVEDAHQAYLALGRLRATECQQCSHCSARTLRQAMFA